jgi:hypothetical membrane protein
LTARIAAACWLAAGIAYVGLEAIAAGGVPGYRYAHDFISDLGRPDNPLSHLMNAAFAVQGTLFFTAAVLLALATPGRKSGLFVGFAAANAVGNVVVATVPSGPAGIERLHVAAAVLAIVGGNAAILAGARFTSDRRSYRAASIGLATAGLLSFGLLAIASTTSGTVVLPSAVWERTSVYTIIVWQVFSALMLLAQSDEP